MISEERAGKFANDWIAAWNKHDLNEILSHYADEIEFSSPFVIRLFGEPTGTLHGKEQLRSYFEKGLAAYPDLTFELQTTLSSINSVVLYYRSVKNLLAAEVMFFNSEGKVVKVVAHYAEPR
ncbi:MAG: nuclear transport factor 2 family protein [Nitrospirae bacterium]|nr:nuclear transport factor 2 family protein [Candidatus Manganitrophaceae bacterium]